MRVLYDAVTGILYHAVADADWLYFVNTTSVPLTTLVLSEIAANAALLQDLRATVRRVNTLGQGKYYFNAGVLTLRSGWTVAPLPSPTGK